MAGCVSKPAGMLFIKRTSASLVIQTFYETVFKFGERFIKYIDTARKITAGYTVFAGGQLTEADNRNCVSGSFIRIYMYIVYGFDIFPLLFRAKIGQ